MNNYVYVALINDRHADPEVQVFADESDAIDYAVDQIPGSADVIEDVDEKDAELTDEMKRDGWLLYMPYSGEGDYVQVMKREIR
jgi:hypothetical protein